MKFNFLRSSLTGDFELGGVLLASSGVAVILTPIIFQTADMFHNGWHFDVAAWCVAYPGGLAALNALGVFAIGKKEKDIAVAQKTTATTSETQ